MPDRKSSAVVDAEGHFRRLFDASPYAMYRMLVNSIPSSVVLIDENLQVVLANRNFLEKARRLESETLGRQLIDVFPRVIVEELQLQKQVQLAFASQHAVEGQRLTYRAPGVPLRTYYYSVIPMVRGVQVGLVMLLLDDVTEQLRLAEEIRRVERHLASVVESANEIMLSTDTKGRILTWNRAVERLSGYRLDEIQGHPLSNYCAADCSESIQAFFGIEASQSGCGAAECDLVTKSGTRIPVSWEFSPMKDDLDRIVGIVAVGRDLTERRKFEQQLLQSQKLAALGVMAGGIAHEVRTPLAISSSAAQFLMEEDITPDFRKECAGKVHIGIQRASVIIENLLRFAHPSTKLDIDGDRSVVRASRCDHAGRQPGPHSKGRDRLPFLRRARSHGRNREPAGARFPQPFSERLERHARRRKSDDLGRRHSGGHPRAGFGYGLRDRQLRYRQYLRSVLHACAGGERHGPGPVHLLLRDPGARRIHRGRKRPGQRKHVYGDTCLDTGRPAEKRCQISGPSA